MHYVIAGAGPAGVIAAETLRKVDPESKITLVGGEAEPPYSRMAIPYYLSGKIEEEGTYLRQEQGHYGEIQVEFLKGRSVTAVRPGEKVVSLDDGGTLVYDRLLVATGSRPIVPPIQGIDLPGIQPCWTLADSRTVHEQAVEGAHVVLIGAGFIGTIVLDALGARKVNLTVVEAEDRMVPRMMNSAGGEIIKKWCGSKGVTVLTSTTVESIEPGGERKFSLKLSNGDVLPADLIITATGVRCNIEFLEGSGVEVDQGVLVNDRLQSNIPEIYAAGDAAQGKDFSLGDYTVHAIQPTAAEHARVAALNMAGVEAAYRGSLSMNVVETLGLVHYTFGRWMGVDGGDHAEFLDETNFQYLRLEFCEDRLVGAINIGPFEHVGVLRGLIQSEIPLGDWKARVMENPKRIMEAYLSVTGSGKTPPRMSAVRG